MLLKRTFDNVNLVHKILRSLIVEWQPKVTIIIESLKMGMPTIQELYGNLIEHELELKRYKKNGDEKKKNSLTLKVLNSYDDEDDEIHKINTKDKYIYIYI